MSNDITTITREVPHNMCLYALSVGVGGTLPHPQIHLKFYQTNLKPVMDAIYQNDTPTVVEYKTPDFMSQ